MKEKSELIEELVNKISAESTKKIAESISLEKLDLSNKKSIFLKIKELDKDIASKLEIIYRRNKILSQDELKQHILNIVKIRAINRTRRIDFSNVEDSKRRQEWEKLETLVNKIQKIYGHYQSLPKKQQEMIDECIDNVKKQLLMMSIKETDPKNNEIKDGILRKLTSWNK